MHASKLSMRATALRCLALGTETHPAGHGSSLQMLLDMENVEELEMYFEVDSKVQGKHVSHELVPNGQ